MGIFSRREPNDRDIQEDIDRAKRMGADIRRVREAHNTHDFLRPQPDRARGKNLSGPASSDASTPKGRRRW
ncbi:hypothetical protein GTY86_24835 [Streptomyces sp. SID5770]|uniref:hypothetical protein n=1 Tax=Streptomyces sp. SID5770 TaxID=2690308 RepID=UPI00136D89B2|nr:hypothetical protein [Streptomyces sp. SID5770]MZE54438.1 hypothetical protein [Streptomyces sp. SID5770]